MTHSSHSRSGLIDLHTHSTTSDGSDTPEELIRNAVGAGLGVVALTDHDTYDGIARARQAAEQQGLEFVHGMEMSCQHHGASVHVLGYGGDTEDGHLLAELVRIRQGRTERVPAMVERLVDLGMDLSVDDVLHAADGAPSLGRPHVADAMVAAGHVKDRAEAFTRYLGEGRPAYVNRYSPTVEQGVETLLQAGAVPVIAHPWGRDSRDVLDFGVLEEFIAAGVQGIEVDHVEHSASDRAQLRAFALAQDVLILGSSDYHGTGKPDNPLGVCSTDPAMYQRLRDAMVAAN